MTDRDIQNIRQRVGIARPPAGTENRYLGDSHSSFVTVTYYVRLYVQVVLLLLCRGDGDDNIVLYDNMKAQK